MTYPSSFRNSAPESILKILWIISVFTFLVLAAVLAGCKKIGLTEPDDFVPDISLPKGTYYSPQLCSISVEAEYALILFTLDGTAPDDYSKIYKEPISIDSNLTLSVRTQYDGEWKSELIVREYELEVNPPQVSSGTGVYDTIPSITLTSPTPGAEIRYSLGATPVTRASPKFSGAITITQSTVLVARAFKPGWTPSDTVSFKYDLNKPAPPVFFPIADTYAKPINVTIKSASSGATVRYTLDGRDPSKDTGEIYKGPIKLNNTVTVKARAFLSGRLPSELAVAHYKISNPNSAPKPVILPSGGTFIGKQKVVISSGLPGSQIRYETHDSEPSENSALYTDTLIINQSLYLKARTFHPAYQASPTTAAKFTIKTPPPLFSHPGGSYSAPQEVALSVPGQPQARIWYTLDGSTPDTGSLLYTKPILIDKQTILKAIASDFLQVLSPVAQAPYNFPIPVKSFSIKDMLITSLNSPVSPDITWNPPNATDKSYRLQFNDSGIVTFNNGKIIALKKGQVAAKAISNDGSNEALFVIRVESKPKRYLRLLHPKGGEIWQAGNRYDIIWTSTGITNDVKLYFGTGTTWQLITGSTPNNGRYSWQAPDTPTKSAKIRIREVNGPLEERSLPFEIRKNPLKTLLKLAWVKTAGGPGSDMVGGAVSDAPGNTYITGTLNYLLHAKDTDTPTAILIKYSPDGTLLWKKSITGKTEVRGISVSVSAQGDIYLLGKYLGEFQADKKLFSPTSERGGLFLAKYSETGSLLWIQLLENANASGRFIRGNALATDESGNVVVTGYFRDDIKLGQTVLTGSSDNSDVFIAKYNKLSGNLLWAVREGGDGNDYSYGIGLSPDGSIFINGLFEKSTRIGTQNLISSSRNNQSMFVAKFNNWGINSWATGISLSCSYLRCFNPVIDSKGGITIAGVFGGDISFGPHRLTSKGKCDMYIVKYSSLGSPYWAVNLGGEGYEYPYCLTQDKSGNLFIAGRNDGPFGNIDVASKSSINMFLAKCDRQGSLNWVKPIELYPITLIADGKDGIKIAGYASNNSNFGSIPVQLEGTDIILVKYNILTALAPGD